MLFKLSNLNSNLALTLGYLNPALNNSALKSRQICVCVVREEGEFFFGGGGALSGYIDLEWVVDVFFTKSHVV